jgi:2-keto-4-pentenoate hydratase
MSMTTSLAERLWTARVDGAVITVADAPATAAAAYGVQAAILAHAGLQRIGWKIGASTKVAMELMAIGKPFIGPLFAPHFHDSGATVPLVAAQKPGLETEFLLGLGADLPPRAKPYEPEEVAAAIAFVAPAFEIVGARFQGGLAGNGLLAIADCAANVGVVRGEPVHDWRRFDLGSHQLRLSVDGAEVASGSGSALVFGGPVEAVTWLANNPILAEYGLKEGEVVMTGTCTGLTPLRSGQRAEADFGELGRVSVSFT